MTNKEIRYEPVDRDELMRLIYTSSDYFDPMMVFELHDDPWVTLSHHIRDVMTVLTQSSLSSDEIHARFDQMMRKIMLGLVNCGGTDGDYTLLPAGGERIPDTFPQLYRFLLLTPRRHEVLDMYLQMYPGLLPYLPAVTIQMQKDVLEQNWYRNYLHPSFDNDEFLKTEWVRCMKLKHGPLEFKK